MNFRQQIFIVTKLALLVKNNNNTYVNDACYPLFSFRMQQLSIPYYIWRNYPHDQPYQGATKRQIWMVKLMRQTVVRRRPAHVRHFPRKMPNQLRYSTTKQWTILLKWAQHWGSSWTICHTKVIYTICHW